MERVSTGLLFDRGTNALLTQQSRLGTTELQLSSGKRVLSPKDDPVSAAYIIDLGTTIEKVEQYQNNANRVRSRLELEDATLDGVTNILPRVQELMVQGLNDTYSAANRNAIAQELRQLNDELMALANTRDSNGEYIFAGYQADTIPFSNPVDGTFVYSGDAGSRSIQISATRQIQDRDNGFDLFMNIDASGGGKRNLFETIHQAIAGLEADAPNGVTLEDIQRAHQHILDYRASVGARLNTVDEQEQVNADFLFNMQTAKSEVEDLDYAEAVSRFQQQLLALQAAQQSFSMVQNLSLFNYL